MSVNLTRGITGSFANPMIGALRASTVGPTTLPQWDRLRAVCTCGCGGICGGTGNGSSIPSPPELTEVQRAERLATALGVVYGSFWNVQKLLADEDLQDGDVDAIRKPLANAMQAVLDRVDPTINSILGTPAQNVLGGRAFVRAEIEEEE